MEGDLLRGSLSAGSETSTFWTLVRGTASLWVGGSDSVLEKGILRHARDEKLVYLAVHNHFGDLQVDFSQIDLDSHDLGYPVIRHCSKSLAECLLGH